MIGRTTNTKQITNTEMGGGKGFIKILLKVFKMQSVPFVTKDTANC